MNESEPFLSICIPTFNRSGYLRETLESVFASLRLTTAPCEVVICNNASPDDTQQMLETLRAVHPALRVYRNAENIGEMNFYETIHHARGKYVWLLGDDDLIDAQFIPTVIRHLEENPDLVVCNHSIHSIDFSKVHREAFYSQSIPERLESRDQVLGAFGIALGLISAAILRKELLFKVPRKTFEQFAPHGLSFFVALCTALKPGSEVQFIQVPMLKYRGGNSPIDWERVFVRGTSAALSHLRAIGYSARSIRRAKAQLILHYLVPRIVQQKKERLKIAPLMGRSARVLSTIPLFYLLAVPIAILPLPMFALFRRTMKRSLHGFL